MLNDTSVTIGITDYLTADTHELPILIQQTFYTLLFHSV